MVQKYIQEKLQDRLDDYTEKQVHLAHSLKNTVPANITAVAEAVNTVKQLQDTQRDELITKINDINAQIEDLHPEILAYREQTGISTDNIRSVAMFIKDINAKFIKLDPEVFGNKVDELINTSNQMIQLSEHLVNILEDLNRQVKRDEE